MPNAITAAGLETQTETELVDFFTSAYEAIYGTDINLDSDTPDGQMMRIFVQVVVDLLDLVTQVYNGFDPDLAIGRVLDERVTYNGIQRQAGTYTTTDCTIVIDQALTLFGLDQDVEPVYTVSDNAGNQWNLVTTVSPSVAGTYSYTFRSAVPGEVLTTPNTITVPVTVVLGVVSINNPSTYLTLGINEESDAVLRVRRQKSVSLASQGYLAGLLAALENINGVTSAFVYENDTSGTVGGVPGHSIWVIIAGSGYSDASIAQAIYTKRNAGCGMFGSISYVVTQPDGSPFVVYWDIVTTVDLYIQFTATSLDGINPPNIAAIKSGLVTSFVPQVFEKVNINNLATDVQAIDPNTLVTLSGFSLTSGGSYTPTLQPASKNEQFVVVADNIIIIPMILSPTVVTVAALGSQQFTALGGFGGMTFTVDVNVSGGSIDGTGLYTAGPTPGTDIVKVVDSLGNEATATVTVT
jgi:hypothetical protein